MRSVISRAIADYNRAISRAANYGRILGPGTARIATGDIDGAIADPTQAIELDPNLAEASFNCAAAWRAKGNSEKAFADYHQSIRINPRPGRHL